MPFNKYRAVGIMASVRAERPGIRIFAVARGFFSSPNRPDQLRVPLSLLFDEYRDPFPGGEVAGA
jgi:hypothetical protein